jgi:N-glycosylase/DNA lyase
MTPKLYDELSSRLAGVWGGYAGWAHSVRFITSSSWLGLAYLSRKVLFTADLKSFSTYGLQTPSPPAKVHPTNTAEGLMSSSSKAKPSLLVTPSPSPIKRKRSQGFGSLVVGSGREDVMFDEPASLAERVKRRRRVLVPVAAG